MPDKGKFVVVNWGKRYNPPDIKIQDKIMKRDEDKRPRPVNKLDNIATAANENANPRSVVGAQAQEVQVYRKIKLVNAPQDPLDESIKMRIESAVRKNFCTRTAMHLREFSAFRKQKLVIELLPAEKLTMTEEEQAKRIETLTTENAELLKEFETTDNNVGLPEKLKTLAHQSWQYGRNLLMILFADDVNTITDLKTLNTRRLGQPILNDEQNLKFEGCFVDGQPLDREAMIYATYEERDISPNAEGYGFSIMELILVQCEIHTLIVQDYKEIALSAFLPSILLRILTDGETSGTKSTQMQNIIDDIEPAKIIGVPADQVEEAIMLEMQPNFEGLAKHVDSLERMIYNAFHVPLFLVKSDEIANRATAAKSAKLFLEGVVADDQEWMTNLLGKQWYDPLLREKLKKKNLLDKTVLDKTKDETVETEVPKGAESPLPFLIRRKFEAPRVEDLIDLADAISKLIQAKVWDVQKANEELGTSEIVQRVRAEAEKLRKEFMQQKKASDDEKTDDKSEDSEQEQKPPFK